MNRRPLTFTLFWLALAAPVAFFAGQALTPGAGLYTRLLSPHAIDWIGAAPKLVFPALAVLLAAVVTRRFEAGNPSRTAWLLLTAGLLGFLLGQATLAWFFARGELDVFPSIGDLFFVLGSLGVIAALAAFLRAYALSGFPIGQPRELWGIGIAATLLSAVLVVPILWPVLAAPAPPLEKLLNIAYPVLDFLMLIPALVLLRVSLGFWGGKVWAVWGALVAGILFTAAGDILFGYLSGLGHKQLEAAVDALYILAYGCIAASVLYQNDLQTAS